MIMRERLYKDAHPLHKVSKKNFFYFIFLRENPLAKKWKKNKEKKKVPRKKKRRVGGGLPPDNLFLAKKCLYGSYPAGASL